ncbi:MULTISPECIES: esterase-like activity of phytase family protein [Pseudomonas]|uniref:Esterase-like activity of phytase family protein n=1 Tax=Pseudomonas saxonica TaxID=2600598 RepID=A0A5C5Q3W0_9PSED|nr:MULTISPECIES: esterase-like activity of phytase family protein [Pseudomonas]MCH4873782.1 DNA topoisomerase IV [Pseudomonas sp. TMW22091]TWS00443.1 esterase-like activity of phytase family protein [Pseudomonas saxonica]
MGRALLLGLCLSAAPVMADTWPELVLQTEHPVEGMRGGNLSGLALCEGEMWTVSDRDDDQIYRLDTRYAEWQAEAVSIQVPPPPESGLPWGVRMMHKAVSPLRGGNLDFEGISCDAAGNRYVVSETHAAVLQVPPIGEPLWLKIDPALVRQARGSGMLLHFNALFEGIAVNPQGTQLWLAAERERRGLMTLRKQQSVWNCEGGCVVMSEGGLEQPPAQLKAKAQQKDFADLALFDGKLFTLERMAYRICRRTPATGEVERCWSFANDALTEPRRYNSGYGTAEALSLDAKGAWVGVDNGNHIRADGEKRPIVWRFTAPQGGWSAKP